MNPVVQDSKPTTLTVTLQGLSLHFLDCKFLEEKDGNLKFFALTTMPYRQFGVKKLVNKFALVQWACHVGSWYLGLDIKICDLCVYMITELWMWIDHFVLKYRFGIGV